MIERAKARVPIGGNIDPHQLPGARLPASIFKELRFNWKLPR
jgi:hypothetical protein